MTDDEMLQEFRMSRSVTCDGENYKIVGMQFHCHAPAPQIIIYMLQPEGSPAWATAPAKEVPAEDCDLFAPTMTFAAAA